MMRVGSLIGRLMQQVMSRRRQIATINLQLVYPDKTATERQQLVTSHFRHVGQTLPETALSWWASPQRLQKIMTIHGLENLTSAAATKQGIILLSGHFTSFELTSRAIADQQPFHYLYKEQRKNPPFQWFSMRVRSRYYRGAIGHHDIRGMVKVLRAGEICWYAPDQDFGTHQSLFADFMGVPTATVTATMRLAKMGKAIVIPYFPIKRNNYGGYDIHILPPLDNFPSGDDQHDVERINQLLGSYVTEVPDQYLWIHRRFRSRPDNQPSPYDVIP